MLGCLIGSPYGKTAAIGRNYRRRRVGLPETGILEWSITGGVIGGLIMVLAVVLGLSHVPKWCSVPEVWIIVQAGLGQVLGWAMWKVELGATGNSQQECADFVFYLFGLATLPILTLFIVVMAFASLL